jgi:ABC-2 type transport system ATP-binding protein
VDTADVTRLRAPASSSDTLTDALLALRENGIGVLDASIQRPTLDEVFLRLTGTAAPTSEEAA